MFGAAVLASVLALAGAPADTSVVCHPELLPVPGGTAVGLSNFGVTPARIDLYGPMACAALLFAAASPTERSALHRLNPAVSFPQIVGVGLLTVLHESTHVGLRSHDECLVEKTALAKLPGLIASYVDISTAAQALTEAYAYDARLPAVYHGC
jgi:hypothetical protein